MESIGGDIGFHVGDLGGHDGGHHGGHGGGHGHGGHSSGRLSQHRIQEAQFYGAELQINSLGAALRAAAGPNPRIGWSRPVPDPAVTAQQIDRQISAMTDSNHKCKALRLLIKVYFDSGDRPEEADALAKLGEVLTARDDDESRLEAAEVFRREALIRANFEDYSGKSRALINLTATLNALCRHEEALEPGTQAVELCLGLDDERNRARSLLELGTSQLRSGRLGPALETFDLILADSATMNAPGYRQLLEHRAQCGAGEALFGLRQFGAAAERYDRASAIWPTSPKSRWPGWLGIDRPYSLAGKEALTRLELHTTAYVEIHNFAEARRIWSGVDKILISAPNDAEWTTALLRRMAGVWRDAGDSALQADALLLIGDTLKTDRPVAAIEQYTEAESIYRKVPVPGGVKKARRRISAAERSLPLGERWAHRRKRWARQIVRR